MRNIVSECKKFSTLEIMPLSSYMNAYNGKDVSIAPLSDDKFNHYKSNLKILEAGCKYMPIICSNLPPYNYDDSKGIILCSTTADWLNAFETFSNPQNRSEAGLILGEYVRKYYDLQTINNIRYNQISLLINKK